MGWSTTDFSVLHSLPEFAQIHVHQVGDAIQPSHSLLPPYPPCPQSFPASGSFPMCWLFTSGGQSIGTSASASVFPVNIQGDWLVWSPCCPRDSQESFPAPPFKSISSSALSLFMVQLSHLSMTTEKNIALTIWNFVSKVMSLFFNMLFRLGIAFLPSERSKSLLVSWLQSPSTVIFKPKKRKSVTASTFSLSLPWSDGIRCYGLRFMNIEF